MTEITLWVDELSRAQSFYVGLLGLEVLVDGSGYVQLSNELNTIHLHLVPEEYRETGDYAVRDSASIKPVFSVKAIPAGTALELLGGKPAKQFSHEGRDFLDVIDPEGNVIQLATA